MTGALGASKLVQCLEERDSDADDFSSLFEFCLHLILQGRYRNLY